MNLSVRVDHARRRGGWVRERVGAVLVAAGIIAFGVLVAVILHTLGLSWCTWKAQMWGFC